MVCREISLNPCKIFILLAKKRTGAFSYQIVQTCFSGWFFQETAWRHEWLISGLVWPCNRIKLVNSIDKTEWFWNIDICCFVGSKHWKNVARLQSSCSPQEAIRSLLKFFIYCAAFNTERLFGLVTLGKGYMKEPNICNKYCKHGSFSPTNDFRCLAYLDPQKVHFKAKIALVHNFMLINFLAPKL